MRSLSRRTRPQPSAIYCEGAVAPAGNVYSTFERARRALANVGPAVMLIDPSLGTPQIANDADLTDIALVAGPGFATLNVADGIAITGMSKLDALALVSLSSSAIFTAPAGLWGFILTNGASISAGSSGSPISVPSSAQLYITMRDGAYLGPNGSVRAITTAGTGACAVDVGRGCSVAASTITGPAYTIYVDSDVVNGSFALTQTGANYSLVTQYERPKFSFAAGAIAGLTAVATTLPPGYAATTITSAVIGHVIAAPGFLKTIHARLTGDVANAGGQTLAMALLRTTSGGVTSTLGTATLATSAGLKTGTVALANPVLLAVGDVLHSNLTPSALLTANLTNLMLGAA